MNSSNTSSASASTSDSYIIIVFAMNAVVLPAVSGFGVVTNLINIIIFSNSKLKENIYTYLLTYSMSNFCFSLITSLCWVSRSGFIFPLSGSYASKFYETYFLFTGLNGFGILSALIEIAISFDRLLLIKKKKLLVPPILVLVGMAIVSTSFATIYGFVRTIKQNQLANGSSSMPTYSIVYNEFGASFAGQFLYITMIIFKNVILLISLTIINCVLAYEMKKFYDHKKKISSMPSAAEQDNNPNKNAKANFYKMIILMFIVYLTGSIPNTLASFCFMYYSTKPFTSYVVAFGNFFQFLSYGINIFAYYNFNSRYKKICISYLKKLTNAPNSRMNNKSVVPTDLDNDSSILKSKNVHG